MGKCQLQTKEKAHRLEVLRGVVEVTLRNDAVLVPFTANERKINRDIGRLIDKVTYLIKKRSAWFSMYSSHQSLTLLFSEPSKMLINLWKNMTPSLKWFCLLLVFPSSLPFSSSFIHLTLSILCLSPSLSPSLLSLSLSLTHTHSLSSLFHPHTDPRE